MKKLIFIFFVCTSIYTFAQSTDVGVNSQFRGNDTTYTFSLLQTNKDLCIEKLIEGIGEPAKQSAGNIIWLNVEIDGVEGKMQLNLKDGIFELKNNKDAFFRPFLNEEDKTKSLMNLSKNRFRAIEIEFTDSEGNNLINSVSAKEAVLAFLGTLLEGVE